MPLPYHPNHDRHPFNKFGCTICHQGQGRATTRDDGSRPGGTLGPADARSEIYPVGVCQVSLAQRCARGAAVGSRARRYSKKAAASAVINSTALAELWALNWTPSALIAARSGCSSTFKNPAAVTPGSAMPPIKASDDRPRCADALRLEFHRRTAERLLRLDENDSGPAGRPAALRRKGLHRMPFGRRQRRQSGAGFGRSGQAPRCGMDQRSFPEPLRRFARDGHAAV